nr:MAG TPA: hypothetical protein [Bacteriophage sp.]
MEAGLGLIAGGRRVDADDGAGVGQLGQRVDAVGDERQGRRRLVFGDDFSTKLAGKPEGFDGGGIELRRGVFFEQDVDFVFHDRLRVAGSVAVRHGRDVNIPDRTDQSHAKKVFVEQADAVEGNHLTRERVGAKQLPCVDAEDNRVRHVSGCGIDGQDRLVQIRQRVFLLVGPVTHPGSGRKLAHQKLGALVFVRRHKLRFDEFVFRQGEGLRLFQVDAQQGVRDGQRQAVALKGVCFVSSAQDCLAGRFARSHLDGLDGEGRFRVPDLVLEIQVIDRDDRSDAADDGVLFGVAGPRGIGGQDIGELNGGAKWSSPCSWSFCWLGLIVRLRQPGRTGRIRFPQGPFPTWHE